MDKQLVVLHICQVLIGKLMLAYIEAVNGGSDVHFRMHIAAFFAYKSFVRAQHGIMWNS